jgi:hypothetical protein
MNVYDLMLVLLCAIALLHGVAITHHLEWGTDSDNYRDVSAAQSILDGYFWNDSLYLGESLWYSPLTPTLVAGMSWLTNSPVHVVHTRLGAYINLLAPISFYVLVASFVNRRVALASTAAFLFLTTPFLYPSWASATYSPTLFPVIFVQTLFYLSLIVYRQAVRSGQCKWYGAAGILLGLTFLGHTAPALILGGIIVLYSLSQWFNMRKHHATRREMIQLVANLFLLLIVAIMVSLPFLYTIVGRYHLHILNPLPNNWRWGQLDGINVIGLIVTQFIWPVSYLAIIGLKRFLSSSEYNVRFNWPIIGP